MLRPALNASVLIAFASAFSVLLSAPPAQAGLMGVCDCSVAERECAQWNGNVDNQEECMATPDCTWQNVFRRCTVFMCPANCMIRSADDCGIHDATVSFEERPGMCEAQETCGSQICINPVAVPANATCTTTCGSNYPLCNNGCSAWQCNTGYVLQNNECVLPPDCGTRVCTNTVAVPANATCTTTCGSNYPACDNGCSAWQCNDGFELVNGACVLPPSDLRISLTVPLEGRVAQQGGAHGTHAIDTLEIRVVGANLLPITLEDIATTDAGSVERSLPGVSVPDGTPLTVSLKTAQHLRRTVVVTVSLGAITMNLADPSSYTESLDNVMKGKPFLPAGDLTGSATRETLNDNRVDAPDIATWIAAFRKGTTPCTTAAAKLAEDLDGNCHVGAEDLSLIVRNFNATGDPVSGGSV